MAAVQQSAETLIQERRAILHDLLVMINEYDKARHDEIKDNFIEKAIRYFNIIASQQKNKADALERADLFLSDLVLEAELCLKICADNNDRGKKILSIYDGYDEARKFIDPTDQIALDKHSFVAQILTEFWGGVPTIAIRQQNKNMAKKVPDEIKRLVETVLKEIENCPKEKQTPYEGEFNRILMGILNNVSDANKQNECEDQLIKLSAKVVQEIRQKNKVMAEKMPDEIKPLVKKVLNEIDNAPKQYQLEYEQSLNKILISVKAGGSDVNKQSECKNDLTKLSEKIVYDIRQENLKIRQENLKIHQENLSLLAEIEGKNLGSAHDSLKQPPTEISKIPEEQQSEHKLQLNIFLKKTLKNAQDYQQKKKECEKAVANEKSKHVLRTVAIVGVGVVATIGLAALSFFTFGAALPHAIFVGGLGFAAMVKALEHNDNKRDKKLQQLRSNLSKDHNAVTENVAEESGKLLREISKSTAKQPSPLNEHDINLPSQSTLQKIITSESAYATSLRR